MNAREYDRWRDLYAVFPFGERAAYIRTAQIVQELWNIHRDRNHHPEPFALRDFLLFADEPEPLTPEQVADKVARQLGAPD